MIVDGILAPRGAERAAAAWRPSRATRGVKLALEMDDLSVERSHAHGRSLPYVVCVVSRAAPGRFGEMRAGSFCHRVGPCLLGMRGCVRRGPVRVGVLQTTTYD